MGGRRPGSSAREAVVVSPGSRRTSRPARRYTRCSTTPRRPSRACRSTRPSSTSAGWSGSPARRATSPSACAGGCATGGPADHGRRGPDEVPGEGGQRRRQTGRPAGGAARRRARLPPPVAGRAAVGRRRRDRRASCTTWGSRPWGRWPGSTEPALIAMPAGRWAGSCTRSRTTAIRAACGRACGGGRSGHSGRWAGRGRTDLAAVDATLVALVDRVTRRMRRGRPCWQHRRPAHAVLRLHPRHAVAHAALPDGRDRRRAVRRPAADGRRHAR